MSNQRHCKTPFKRNSIFLINLKQSSKECNRFTKPGKTKEKQVNQVQYASTSSIRESAMESRAYIIDDINHTGGRETEPKLKGT